MSTAIVSIIQTRIKAATPASPIVIFKPSIRSPGFLDAVFGMTVATYRRVCSNDPLFVGYFDRSMDADEVFRVLTDAAR